MLDSAEIAKQIEAIRLKPSTDAQLLLSEKQHTQQMATLEKTTRLEAFRMAKEILMENAKAKPVNEREITPADITNYADALFEQMK
jgi:hypothetical protein